MFRSAKVFISPLVLCSFVTSVAQRSADTMTLSKNSFSWSQEEKEYGFSHFDQVFKTRDVPNGRYVHELPRGGNIASFDKGGDKEGELETFLKEQKVAGVVIVQDGKIRLERYALGFSDGQRWTSQSVAKSVIGTLVGAAIKDKFIKSVDDHIADYIPELKGTAYDKVTIRHMLTMTTGVRWNENYSDANSDIVKFYAQPVEAGLDETVSYLKNLPSEAEPGKRWKYNTGETHLLGVLVKRATGMTASEYLSKKVWIPYGMEGKATWNVGRTDQEFTGCCLQMNLRDYARFGLFMLDSARINGVSILPDHWMQEATHAQVSLWPGWGYGYLWWTVSDGTYRALGIYGQMIYVDPTRRLVVVMASVWPEAESFQRQTIVEEFLRSVSRTLDGERR